MAAFGDQIAGAATGERVRAFYERHPYPPPIDDLSDHAGTWNDARRRSETHLIWPDKPYREDRAILVAGCGTSQAAKYALRWPKAHVTGIDFSRASVECTAQLKRKHCIRNLELRQLPLECAADVGRQFDHVVCTGVLHHLDEPERGLRALRDVLNPDGALQLMVYAPYGRTGIYMLQEYCRRLGIGTSSEEIRGIATSLNGLPRDHPLIPLLKQAADFRTDAGLADALLNPQDRAYSVPQLFELLESADLNFGRWIRQAPYLAACGAFVQSPHHAAIMRLPLAEHFAVVELFRGTMTRHSLVAYRDDNPRVPSVSFEDDECWLDYVPIRIPATIVVEEALPPGVAAVLINRAHTYTDLYLPVDSLQKGMFERVDGLSTIRQIVPEESLRAAARVLFERLWQYDQLVFDTSSTMLNA